MDKLSKDELLHALFYDLDKGYVPADKLYKQAKAINSDITLEEVKKFVNARASREKKAYKGSNSYVAKKALEEIELDIADMTYLKGSKKYMLVGIDIFTKLGWAVPMDSKSSAETAEALEQILKKIGTPDKIYTDSGSEFQGETAKLMAKHKITHQTTLAHANFAERFIRTLKNKINDRVEFTKNDWVKFVPNVLNQYNSTEHRTTRLTPLEAKKAKNSETVKDNIDSNATYTRTYETLSVGDYVRLLNKKDKYGKLKEHVSNWSDEKYKIISISVRHGVKHFKLEDYPKLFLRHEIKKTTR